MIAWIEADWLVVWWVFPHCTVAYSPLYQGYWVSLQALLVLWFLRCQFSLLRSYSACVPVVAGLRVLRGQLFNDVMVCSLFYSCVLMQLLLIITGSMGGGPFGGFTQHSSYFEQGKFSTPPFPREQLVWGTHISFQKLTGGIFKKLVDSCYSLTGYLDDVSTQGATTCKCICVFFLLFLSQQVLLDCVLHSLQMDSHLNSSFRWVDPYLQRSVYSRVFFQRSFWLCFIGYYSRDCIYGIL